MKRKIMMLISIILLVMASTAIAAIPGDVSEGKYIKAYVRGTQNVAAFKDSSLRTRGNSLRAPYNAAVYPSDEIRIYQMNGSVAYIGYIAGSKWAKAYIPTSAITLNNSSRDGQKFSSGVGRGNVFARPNGTVYSGSAIDAGDTVWKLAEENGYTQVVYPAGSVYKMAWIRTSDYNSRVSRVAPVPQSNQGSNVVRTLPNGWYQISPTHDLRHVLDINGASSDSGANLMMYTPHGGNNQKFYLQNRGDGWFSLKVGYCDNYITADGNYAGANLSSRPWNGSNNQLFKLVDGGGGSYHVIAKVNQNLNFDCAGGGKSDATNVQLWTKENNSAHHKWKFTNTSAPSTPVPTPALVPVTTKFRYPLNNIYVCGNDWMTKYSKRPSRPYHAGIDVKSSSGDKTVYATADGTVAASGWNSANGNFVILQHVLNGKTIYSFYCHMSKRSVSKGNSVKCGMPIGIIGNTGSASAGEHLHFAFVDRLMTSGGYWGYVTSTGKAVTYQGYTFYSPAFVIDNQRLP